MATQAINCVCAKAKDALLACKMSCASGDAGPPGVGKGPAVFEAGWQGDLSDPPAAYCQVQRCQQLSSGILVLPFSPFLSRLIPHAFHLDCLIGCGPRSMAVQ